jgi:glycosyltransferase involved in cell wall biosynthesis
MTAPDVASPPPRLRVLIVTFGFPDRRQGSYDGKFVQAEAEAYARAGAHVTVITPHYAGAPRHEALEAGLDVQRVRYFWPESLQRLKVAGKPIYRIGSPLALLQVPCLLAALGLRVLREATRNDVIHAQWTVSALLALPARWLRRKPVVVTARGSDLRLLPRWLNRWLLRRVDAAIDCFGPIEWNTRFKREFPARLLTLPLIASIEPLPPVAAAPGAGLRLLYLGRLDPIKIESNRLPIFELVEAVARLQQRGVPVSLDYVGGGEPALCARLGERIAQLGLERQVRLCGPTLDVQEYIARSDLGIGGAGLNGVVHDYVVCRLPQILMLGMDSAELLWEDRRTALVVPPRDVAALADAIEWAATHRDVLRQIGVQAREAMRPYIVDRADGGPLYLRAFASLVERREAGARLPA